MAEFEKPKHGEICWRELHTQNLGAAVEFYQGLFGWTMAQSPLSPIEYKEIHFADKVVGGMMEINEGWGENWQNIPAAWRSYIAVDDIAESVENIKKFGGGVSVPPFDAPGIGKISVVTDPSGITFSVIQFVVD
jgi:uncharacterized protein